PPTMIASVSRAIGPPKAARPALSIAHPPARLVRSTQRGAPMSDTWLWMSAGALGRGIGQGAIDPRDLLETYLDAIDAHPDAAAIYARLTPARARAEADAARARAQAGT